MQYIIKKLISLGFGFWPLSANECILKTSKDGNNIPTRIHKT